MNRLARGVRLGVFYGYYNELTGKPAIKNIFKNRRRKIAPEALFLKDFRRRIMCPFGHFDDPSIPNTGKKMLRPTSNCGIGILGNYPNIKSNTKEKRIFIRRAEKKLLHSLTTPPIYLSGSKMKHFLLQI